MDVDPVAGRNGIPARRHALEALAAADGIFRALCFDFVEAQMALQRWRTLPSPVRAKRCSEYEELVASLAGEIESYLDAAAAGSVDVP